MRTRYVRLPALAAALLLAACAPQEDAGGARAAGPWLPPDDAEAWSFEPGSGPGDLAAAVDAGLRWEEYLAARRLGDKLVGKGPDWTRFVVVRAGDRHGAHYRPERFHVVVGAGVRLPAGALRIRRDWGLAANLDGRNEQLETMGLGVVVEPGAPQPFPPAVEQAVAAFCAAVARRAPLHPDCVVAMADVPYMAPYDGAEAERTLAAAARTAVPVPEPDGTLTVVGDDARVEVAYELRDTQAGIRSGMMMRRGFDGKNRGMLFRYPHPAMRRFWNRNVSFPLDLAYVSEGGRIEQILTMPAQAGTPPSEIPLHESNTAVPTALEMPAGWFAARGLAVGDRIEGIP